MVCIALPAAVLSVLVNASTGGAAANLTRLDKKLKGTAATGEAMGTRVAKASKYAALGLAAGAAGSVYAAMKFESAFAEVRKTVDTNEKGFKRIEKGLRGLALQIPVSANELANLAGEAGALGVKSRDIVKFTKTASMLGTTTNLSSEEAANSLARLANIMNSKDKKAFERMGSTLVDLGNKGASTEDEIAAMALRIAGAGKTLGLTEAQVLGLSSSLANVGIRAEMGGTAVSRVMLQMQEAVAKGGPELQNFADITGVSIKEFEQQFARNAPGAIALFAQGLGRMNKAGEPIISTLKGVELGGSRVGDLLLRIAGNTKEFTGAQGIANKAWKANSALAEEAQQRYKTFESQLKLLKNIVIETGVGIGQQLLPDLKAMVKILSNPKLTLDEKIERIGERLSGMIEKWGPKIAEAGAKIGFELAKGFTKAFLNSPIWTQLAVGGFLLAKFGGVGAFGKLGSKTGRAWGAGFIAALLGIELGKQIKLIIEGHPLDAPKTEEAAVKVQKAFGVALGKVTIPRPNRVRVSTEIGDLIFNAQTEKVVAAKGKRLQQFVGQIPGQLLPKFDRLREINRKFDAALAPLPGKAQRTAMGVNRAFLPKLDQLINQGGNKSDAFAERVGGSFSSLNTNVGAALQAIIGNVRNALSALGVKGALKQFALKNPDFVYGTGTTKNQAKQQGGSIVPGSGSGDTFKTMLPAGSFIENRVAAKAPPVTFQKGGLMPVALEPGERVYLPSEVQSVGQRNLEARNKAFPRFQKGGQLAKPQIAGPAGPLLDMGQGAVDKVHGAAGKLLAKKRRAAGGLGSAPGALGAIEALGHAMGLTTTSGYRPGDPGWHGQNRARDLAGSAAQMLAFAKVTGRRWGARMLELIHTPLGWAIKNGQKVAPYAQADHYDHVHTAMQKGGLLQKLAEGGWVKTGYTTYDVDGPGAYGNLMSGKGYAELGTATSGGTGTGTGYIAKALGRSGELPKDYPLDVKIGNTSGTLYKRDRGYGQGDPYYSIDIHRLGWSEVGLSGNSKGTAHIRPADGSGKSDTETVPGKYEGARTKSLSFPSVPKSMRGLEREINRWQRDLRIYRRAARVAKQEGKPKTQQAIEANVKALENHLRKLRSARSKLRKEIARKRFSSRLGKQLGKITGQEQVIEAAQRGYESASQYAEQVVGLEPTEEILSASATASQREAAEKAYVRNYSSYIEGQERPAYEAVLGKAGIWRNTTLGAEHIATNKEMSWESGIRRRRMEVKAIQRYIDNARKHLQEWQNNAKGKGKGKMPDRLRAEVETSRNLRDRLPDIRFQERELMKVLGEGRGAFYGGAAYGIDKPVHPPKPPLAGSGTFEDSLMEVQGRHWPDQHEKLATLPAQRVAGVFGGAIWETQAAIEELGLKIKQAQAGLGGGGSSDEGDSERSTLLEELLRQANQRTAVSDAQRLALEGWDARRQGFAGMFAKGGMIPAGMWGIAGERGPEPVVGPARIFSNQEGQAMFGGVGGGALTVVVNGDVLQEKGDKRDPIEVLEGDHRFVPLVQQAARSARGVGINTPGSSPRR